MTPYDPNGYLDFQRRAPYAPLVPYAPATAAPAASVAPAATSAGDATTNAGLVTGNPYVGAAGLGIKGVGTALSIYGAFKSQEEADKQAELQRQAWEAEQQQQAFEDEERRKQATLGNAYALSQYQAGTDDRTLARLLPYNRAIGR